MDTKKCCWILPNGEIINCAYGNHAQTAAKYFSVNSVNSDIEAERLAEQTWVKITRTETGQTQICFFCRPTQEQKNVLETWCHSNNEFFPFESDLL